jgi:hypothetical protein
MKNIFRAGMDEARISKPPKRGRAEGLLAMRETYPRRLYAQHDHGHIVLPKK